MAVAPQADSRALMSEEIADRLKRVRQDLALSQRAMAKRMEVSPTTYSSWELGRTVPNALSLKKLAEFGIDIHWFVTGEGVPEHNRSRSSTHSDLSENKAQNEQTDPISDLLLAEIRNSGLGDTLLLSRRGTQNSQWEILRMLLRDSNGAKTPEDLRSALAAEGTSFDLADIAADCRLLHAAGDIQAEATPGIERYFISGIHKLRAEKQADRLQALRASVRVLTDIVAPSATGSGENAYLQNAIVTTSDGKAFISKIRSLLIEEINGQNQAKGDDVHIVLAMATKVDSSNKI